MTIYNPFDPIFLEIFTRLRDLESANPLNNSAVDRGALTVNSVEGLRVNGSEVVTGQLMVDGWEIVDGTLWVRGTMTVDGQLNIDGPTSVTGTFTTEGEVTLNGPASVTGSFTVRGMTDFTGDVKITGAVEISGAALLKSTLTLIDGGKIRVTGATDLEIGALSGGGAGIDFGQAVISSNGSFVTLASSEDASGPWVGVSGTTAVLGFGSGARVIVAAGGIYLDGLTEAAGPANLRVQPDGQLHVTTGTGIEA